MIQDARVLQPEFVPGDLVHRHAEVDTLTAALEPLTAGRLTDPVFLHGPSGTGKTCLARHTVEQLRDAVSELHHQYVNCWEEYTRFKVLYRILDGIGESHDIHRQSTPRDVLLDRLRAVDPQPSVVILDEVDQLEDKRFLYELYRTPGVAIVLIANDQPSVFGDLNSRLTSRFQTSERIRFDRYTVDELVSILEDRVRLGLDGAVVSTNQLATIGNLAAGDARVAIGILRSAARTASQQACETIPDAMIEDVVPDAKADIRRSTLEKLTADQQVLYEIVADADEIAPQELYSAYRARVDDPKTDRTVRKYLAKMARYNLIVVEGENRGRTYSIQS